jgi:hypothetical protein
MRHQLLVHKCVCDYGAQIAAAVPMYLEAACARDGDDVFAVAVLISHDPFQFLLVSTLSAALGTLRYFVTALPALRRTCSFS